MNSQHEEKVEIVGYSYVYEGADIEEAKKELSLLTECHGCNHDKNTDILVHLEFCLRCKRAYHAEEDRYEK